MGHDTHRTHQHVAGRPFTRCLVIGVLAISLLALVRADAAAGSTSVSGSTSNCEIVASLPSPPVNAKTFSRSGGGDDVAMIQQAINGLSSGDWLVFSPGSYTISKHLVVPVSGVTLYGKGAILHSSNPADGGVLIEGDDVAVYGFTLNQDSVRRLGTPWAGGLSVFDGRAARRRRVLGTILQGNTINHAAAAGIFLYKARYFTVAGNTVFRSWADGIHATGGSSDGRIVHNSVSENGDDMIAIVSYAGERNVASLAARYRNWSTDDLDRNIYVAGNKLSDTYWGRGIAVVGGSDITIENNDISRTPTAAGIYLLRESSYATYGDHNILVRRNSISQVQTMPPTYMPPNITPVLTHHGAIEISSQMSAEESADSRYKTPLSVSGIAIVDNAIRGARFAGVRIGAVSGSDRTVTDVLVQGNSLDEVGMDSVATVYPGVERGSLTCSNNKLNGVPWPSRCDKSDGTSTARAPATGASLTCLADGSIVKPVSPNPPTSVRQGR